jgi:hypothetical protein
MSWDGLGGDGKRVVFVRTGGLGYTRAHSVF